MTEVWLKVAGARDRDSEWVLFLNEKGGYLENARERIVLNFDRADAPAHFIFPSFLQSIKNLGIRTDDGDVVWFLPHVGPIATIKKYLHGAIAAQGPKAIRSLRLRGWLLLLAGLTLTLGSTALSIISLIAAHTNPEGGRYVLAFGLIIAGLVLTSRGVVHLSNAGRAARHTAKEEEED